MTVITLSPTLGLSKPLILRRLSTIYATPTVHCNTKALSWKLSYPGAYRSLKRPQTCPSLFRFTVITEDSNWRAVGDAQLNLIRDNEVLHAITFEIRHGHQRVGRCLWLQIGESWSAWSARLFNRMQEDVEQYFQPPNSPSSAYTSAPQRRCVGGRRFKPSPLRPQKPMSISCVSKS